MSHYKDTFERMSTRGTPIGANALIQRVESDLSDPVPHVSPPRRRVPGLAVALIAFAVVLAIGVGWVLLTPRGPDIADNPIDQWIELGNEDGVPVEVTAGPGGVLRWPRVLIADRGGLQFSPDGENWSDVQLPGVATFTGVHTVAVTSDRWLITASSDGDTLEGWVSPDGLTWTPVEWPDGLDETIGDIIGSRNGFMGVSIDVFGEGTTLWWSVDGEQWSQLDNTGPGDVVRANLRGTSGGIVWIPFATDDTTQRLYHSNDGSTWVEGSIELPPELTVAPTRFRLSVIDYVGGQWIAIGQVSRTAADPVLHVWVSSDGVEWTAQGLPEFGRRGGAAVDVFTHAVIADQLVVAPTLTPLAEGDDGIVTAAGFAISTGELWATNDGVSWDRVFRTDSGITTLAGTTTNEGMIVGFWVASPRSDNESPVVTTLAPTVDPLELDQAGLDLQNEILADGVVTRDEFQRALEGWKSCMEERGLIEVSFEINAQGGSSRTYGSPDPNAGEAEDAACSASYLNQVADALGP